MDLALEKKSTMRDVMFKNIVSDHGAPIELGLSIFFFPRNPIFCGNKHNEDHPSKMKPSLLPEYIVIKQLKSIISACATMFLNG